MKKTICILLAVCASITMTACSNNSKENSQGVSGDNSLESSDTSSNNEPTGIQVEAGRNVNINLVRITGDGVNIREKTNTDCEILTKGYTDDYFAYTETVADDNGDTWYKIIYNNAEAYVHGNYSTIESLSPEIAAEKLDGDTNEDSGTNAETDADANTNTEDGEA